MNRPLLVLMLLAAGCTSLYDAPPQSAAHLDIGRGLPQPTPSPFGLGSGDRGVARERFARAPAAALEEYLKPEFRTRPSPPSATPPVRTTVASVVSEPARRVPTPPTTAGAATMSRETAPVLVTLQTTSDAERYGAREKTARSQEQFRGGDAIIIGAGTIVLVLLVVLLVLVLT